MTPRWKSGVGLEPARAQPRRSDPALTPGEESTPFAWPFFQTRTRRGSSH